MTNKKELIEYIVVNLFYLLLGISECVMIYYFIKVFSNDELSLCLNDIDYSSFMLTTLIVSFIFIVVSLMVKKIKVKINESKHKRKR